MKLSKTRRAEILGDFMQENGGVYNPAAFVAHVRETGESHPAWEWFTWSDEEAAEHYRIDQARAFVSDLRIVRSVETIIGGSFRIIRTEQPLVLSPMGRRSDGGGYVETHITDLCAEAAVTFGAAARRYAAALAHVGADVEALEQLRVDLLAASQPVAIAAE